MSFCHSNLPSISLFKLVLISGHWYHLRCCLEPLYVPGCCRRIVALIVGAQAVAVGHGGGASSVLRAGGGFVASTVAAVGHGCWFWYRLHCCHG